MSPDPVRPTRVVLLRHGETDHNATTRIQGHVDVPLNARGLAQAAATASVLAARGPVRIVSSDLARAAVTASALGAAAGVAVERDERLRETHLGQWQGLTHAEVRAEFPGQLEQWWNSATFTPPGGESRVQVAARGTAVLTEVAAAAGAEGGLVVLVAHGGIIAATVARVLGLPEQRWFAFGGTGNARWAELQAHSVDDVAAWRMRGWNVGVDGG